jgi:hypothetical protein
MINGKETHNLMRVNFRPKKEASNIVKGILQTAAAPIYVKITESLAPFLCKEYAIGKAIKIPPTVVVARIIPQKYPLNPLPLPKCFSIVSFFTQTSKRPISTKTPGKRGIMPLKNFKEFFPTSIPAWKFNREEISRNPK